MAQIEIVEVAELEREDVFPLGAALLRITRFVELARDRSDGFDLHRQAFALGVELAERVEVFEVRRRIGEADALVLRGDVAEIGRELAELRGGAQPSVHERATSTTDLDGAANDDLDDLAGLERNAGGLEALDDA